MNRRDLIKNTAAALGISLVGISMSEILVSCKKEANLDWKPVFFTNYQAALVAEIAETILPKTKTPGAKEMGVPPFIDKMVKETMDEVAQKELIEGLGNFEDGVNAKFGKSFLEITEKEKLEYLEKEDKDKPRSGLNMWGISLEKDPPKPTFFKTIKGLTLLGFYTSEEIGRNVLVYDPVPGEYIGCMPLNGQNSWTE
ncbi:gluconate 2-dehydrogenase subunit 3 family protein [Lacihabitans sp. LS3-19]|uniref:gluconate 2-dehydrogenase subunit 3 family protein n=1 Tax=Lacihabitans sp. LS3-19 TaxID=2487335 RepID=UPI0020CF7CC9|nr:gluconate 2-dehydrogenase subunit 3 family protein [Lacihabitans sp. LS3-19]MCP9769641.1 gluconate 2-dehydrogenase subunit 3 family protein [Lacihabitans sp. LS3-19]